MQVDQSKKEDAWLAVINNFPQDKMYKRRAQEQLALLYLKLRRFDEASAIYRELVNQRDGEPYRATGIAGEAIIASLKGEHEKSQHLIEKNKRLLEKNLNSTMKQYILETIRQNQAQLQQEVKQELEDLFKTEPPASDNLDLE